MREEGGDIVPTFSVGSGWFLPPASAAQGCWSAGSLSSPAHTWHIWRKNDAADETSMEQLIQYQVVLA